jgi:trehalose synthase
MANERTRRAWRFLGPYLQPADAYVFTRRQFVWEDLNPAKSHVILPSLNPLAPKNQELSPSAVSEILTAGLQPGAPTGDHTFTRVDGSPGRVDRALELIQSAPLDAGTDVILQVSHWNA